MKELTNNRWMFHPWNDNHKVELIPVSFLDLIRNKNNKPFTDDLDGNIIHEDEVWKDIELNGMFEPLIIRIGFKNKTIRLESGNHRIRSALKNGYTHLPVATFVANDAIAFPINGHHQFLCEDIIHFQNLIPSVYNYQILLSDFLLKDFHNITFLKEKF